MIHRTEFGAMGSGIEALVDCKSRPDILDEVPGWFEEWEQVLSRFRVDSELSLLNLGAGRTIPVSQTLWDVFQAARAAERFTGGLVNPLVLDALRSAGYDRSFELLGLDPRWPGTDFEEAVPCLSRVVATEASRSILLPEGLHLDFGGIAKGWAAHQAAARLNAAGPAVVNAGGDIAISGAQLNGEPWPIGVEDPFQRGAEIEMLFVKAGGVATSGKDYHRWNQNGFARHHIIDPRSGVPAETDTLAATVISPNAIEAEAMAKSVLILGSRAGILRLDEEDRSAGLLVLENGERLLSKNLARFL